MQRTARIFFKSFQKHRPSNIWNINLLLILFIRVMQLIVYFLVFFCNEPQWKWSVSLFFVSPPVAQEPSRTSPINLRHLPKITRIFNNKIFFTSSSNDERSFNFIKYARKKILNLTLGVKFCIFCRPRPVYDFFINLYFAYLTTFSF